MNRKRAGSRSENGSTGWDRFSYNDRINSDDDNSSERSAQVDDGFFDQGKTPKKHRKAKESETQKLPISYADAIKSMANAVNNQKPEDDDNESTESSLPSLTSNSTVSTGKRMVVYDPNKPLPIQEGCPLCICQVGIKEKTGYLLPSVVNIEETLFKTAFLNGLDYRFNSIMNLMNKKVRPELRKIYKVDCEEVTLEAVQKHMKECRIDPALITHRQVNICEKINTMADMTMFVQNPITGRVGLDHKVVNTYLRNSTFLMKLLATDLTKLSGYQPGATGANPNRIKGSLVQVSSFRS